MEFLLYLAGPIQGRSYEQATSWRAEVAGKLPPQILPVSPMRSKEFLAGIDRLGEQHRGHPLNSWKGFTRRDFFDVERCDMILFNFLEAEELSRGSFIEIGRASADKPMVVVIKPGMGNPHDYAMVHEIAWYEVDTLDAAVDVVKAVLLPGL